MGIRREQDVTAAHVAGAHSAQVECNPGDRLNGVPIVTEGLNASHG